MKYANDETPRSRFLVVHAVIISVLWFAATAAITYAQGLTASRTIFGEGAPGEWGSEEKLPVGVFSPGSINGFGTSISGGNSDRDNPLLPVVVRSPVFEGSRALRFRVPGNRTGGNSSSFRSEVSLDHPVRNMTDWQGKLELWYGFAVRIETGAGDAERPIIFQSHTANQSGGSLHPPGGSPGQHLVLRAGPNGQWRITRRWYDGDPAKLTSTDMVTNVNTHFGSIAEDIGKWVHFVIHVKYDPFGNGFLHVWKDDELVVSESSVPMGINDGPWGYDKFGLYVSRLRSNSGADQEVTIDRFRVADHTGSYAAVHPASNLDPLRPKPPYIVSAR